MVSQSASIRAAAETLNISAPALSRQLQLLERSYGTTLLLRSATGVALTAEGEALRDEAMGWLAADAEFSRRLQQGARERDLHLRIGVMEGLSRTLMPQLSERLEESFGDVELELTVGTTRDLVSRAESLELDLLIAFNTPRLSRLVVVHSREYHLGAVYAPDFPLSGDGPLGLGEALQHPLCLPTSALSLHTRLLAEILSERVNPRVFISSNSIAVLLHYLRAGRGVGFLPWTDVSEDVLAGKLVFRAIDNHRLTESLSICLCRGNSLGAANGEVVALISEQLDKLGR